MRILWRVIAAATGAAVAAGASPAATQRASREQRATVLVVDRDNQAAPGLGPADFAVREDGIAREVLRVEQAADPMQVVVLADTSEGTRLMIPDIRAGVRVFSQTLMDRLPETEIGLMEFGERPAVIADRATAANLIARAADRLNERIGSGAYLLDAVVDATALLRKREATRGAIVAFVSASSPEFSSRTSQEIEKALREAHASLWVILLQDRARSVLSDEGQQREIVMGDVVSRSGGLRDIVLDRMGIEAHFKQLADLLASQYAVIYARPESLIPPTRLDVSVKRSGLRALAPRWTGQ